MSTTFFWGLQRQIVLRTERRGESLEAKLQNLQSPRERPQKNWPNTKKTAETGRNQSPEKKLYKEKSQNKRKRQRRGKNSKQRKSWSKILALELEDKGAGEASQFDQGQWSIPQR